MSDGSPSDTAPTTELARPKAGDAPGQTRLMEVTVQVLTMPIVVVGVALVISGVIGGWVAQQKRRDFGEGFLAGILLGPIGWLIEAMLPTGEPEHTVFECPKCKTVVSPGTVFCPTCGHQGSPNPCPRCGRVPMPSEAFCRRCGLALRPTPPT